MNNPWHTISQKVIYINPFGFRLREDEVIDPSGQPSTYMVLEGGDFVTIVAITPQQQVVFVNQWRYPLGRELLELPAGHLNEHEDPLTAAKRELLEETGGISHEWYSLGSLWVAVGATKTKNHILLALGVDISQPPQLEASESLTCKLIPLKSAFSAAATGHLEDEKTVAALYLAQFFLSTPDS